MCTVTYIPIDDKRFIFTSNRDESPMRKTIPPVEYDEGGVKMTYPKDELAGGTWIGVSEKQRLVCLLNGGFEKHTRNEYYRMSRGVVVKKLLQVSDPVATITEFDFENIEPFTIVMVDWSTSLKAYELVWDGNQKHFNELENRPKIWSSSTLYDMETKQLRIQWFEEWMQDRAFTPEEILAFHRDTEKGEIGTSLKMKRPFVETVSITSIQKEPNSLKLSYFDLLKDRETFLTL